MGRSLVTPSRFQMETLSEMGATLFTGFFGELAEVNAASAHKEYVWTQLTPSQKGAWTKAADKGWGAYVDNNAIKMLSLQEPSAVRKDLARRGELDRILTPRYMLTDKNDGLRSPDNPLPVEHAARLVVPGFKDRANLEGELRRDAPTGSSFP